MQCKTNKTCPFIPEPGVEIDIYNILLYSKLLDFWYIFEKITLISPLDSQGYLTMTMTDAYLKYVDIDFMSPTEFWDASAYCLIRKNEKIMAERKRRMKQRSLQ